MLKSKEQSWFNSNVFTVETAKMILKTISSWLLLVYVLTFFSAAEAANHFLESNAQIGDENFQFGKSKFQAALLINKREDNFWNRNLYRCATSFHIFYKFKKKRK